MRLQPALVLPRREWARRLLLGLPLGLLLFAAGAQPARVPVLAALALGFILLRLARDSVAHAWASCIPIAVSLAWAIGGQSCGASDGGDCTNPFSLPAMSRLAEALLVLGALGLLSRAIGSNARELALRKPRVIVGLVSLAGFVVLAPAGLLLGAWLAGPFFGSITLDFSRPAAILPALIFAIANGAMEEVAYRSALLGWLGRLVDFRVALGAQALVFGVAHSGRDYVGSPLPVMAAMTAGALVAGLIVRRTGSLVPVILLHAALDVPLYYYLACRLG